MAYRLAVALVVAALVLTAAAQETSDCPAHSEINNGICRDKDGADCSKEHQPTICYDTEPQYTDEAAKANTKGTVELWATVRTDGCAYDIKVTTTLGYGLDEAAISALERFRFSRPLKAVHVEFNFDPKFSSRTPLTAPPCVKLAHNVPIQNNWRNIPIALIIRQGPPQVRSMRIACFQQLTGDSQTGLEFRAMRALKFGGLLLVNLAVAVIGTAILDTALWRVISSHSVAAIVWKEFIFSIVCAAFIGFGMWRTWRNSAAKWTWVLPAVWFAFGYLTIAGHGDVWGRLFGFGSGSVLSAPDVRSFFLFTVPLVRAVSYSVGAYLSSLLYPAPVVPA